MRKRHLKGDNQGQAKKGSLEQRIPHQGFIGYLEAIALLPGSVKNRQKMKKPCCACDNKRIE